MFKYRLPIFLPLNIFWKMQIEVIYIPPPPKKKEKSTQKTFTKWMYLIKISESVDVNFNSKFTAKIIIIDVQWHFGLHMEAINKK